MPLFGSSSRSKLPLPFLSRNKQNSPAQKSTYINNKSTGSRHSDPPPAYTPVSATSATAPSFPAASSEGGSLAASPDQPDSFLAQFDTVFLIEEITSETSGVT
ncbi:von Willebrand factor [Trichophyton violaceum]|uniref:von Willebrand factor n=1 Tax=Trichophyton violaceum TaxID=34388 RepID=A0A178FIU0_TRIVO|nr:von Willebrand factor [Trichophyton violaceum]